MTGAKAIVKIADEVVAFCSDVSYSVNVQHIPVEALGIFEIISNEPVAYTVEGTFSVVRYSSGGNPQTQLNNFATSLATDSIRTNNAADIDLSEGTLQDHINPAKILSSSTFKLEVVDKSNTSSNMFILENCRITRRSSSLNKRNVLVDNYAFVAVLAQDSGAGTTDAVVGTTAGGVTNSDG
jgi:hypothetical protein